MSRFLHLADEAEVPKKDRKRELWRKLPLSLRKPLITELYRLSGTFVEFSTLALQYADSFDIINRQTRSSRATFSSTGGTTSATAATVGKKTTPSVGTEMKKESMSTGERAEHLRDGKCFRCHEPSHLSRECPKKPKPTVAAIEIADKELRELE